MNYHDFFTEHIIYPLFLYPKLCFIYFLQLFFMHIPTISFSLWSYITYVHRTVFFNFFSHKNFFRPIWRKTFCKTVFICRYTWCHPTFEPPPLDLIPPNLAQSYCDPPLFVRGLGFLKNHTRRGGIKIFL